MPYISVYAATKAFQESWSQSLAAELEENNIDVFCLRPGLTVSEMSSYTEASLFVASSKRMATVCLNSVRPFAPASFVPYLPHAFLDTLNSFVPERSAWSAARKVNIGKH
mmetsp:Transcript_18533/g.22770  ORF Transcript_18533/g.22770 Transcript_18533/m.22770 type:complete len:110 (+) Transcript_18533:451-780(+)